MFSKMTGIIECRRDITIEQNIGEDFSKLKVDAKKFFSSVCYTADGTCVIAGSKSQFLNMYSVAQKVLVKRFVLTTNLSLSGVKDLDYLYVPQSVLQYKYDQLKKKHYNPGSKIQKIIGEQNIPGATNELIPDNTVFDMCFSPTNREFAVSTTEGILIFSTDAALNFQPLDIDPSITSGTIIEALEQKNYSEALVVCFLISNYSYF